MAQRVLCNQSVYDYNWNCFSVTGQNHPVRWSQFGTQWAFKAIDFKRRMRSEVGASNFQRAVRNFSGSFISVWEGHLGCRGLVTVNFFHILFQWLVVIGITVLLMMIGVVSWEVIDVGDYNALPVTEYLAKNQETRKKTSLCVYLLCRAYEEAHSMAHPARVWDFLVGNLTSMYMAYLAK